MTDNPGSDAAFELRLAQLSEEQFDAVVARTRPHTPPPQTALQRMRAEMAAKSQQLLDIRASAEERTRVHLGVNPPVIRDEPARQPWHAPPTPAQQTQAGANREHAAKAELLARMMTGNPDGI